MELEAYPEIEYLENGDGTQKTKSGEKNGSENLERETAAMVTNKGDLILVDEADYEDLSRFTWYVNKDGYAQTNMNGRDGKKRIVMMHRYLMRAPRGVEVDHRDQEPLNNTRWNLRLATHTQNAANRVRHSTSRSRWKGVLLNKTMGKWYAKVRKGGCVYTSFPFHYEASAAIGYNILARFIFGEFARGNVVEEIV